jgi:hypothetical protein
MLPPKKQQIVWEFTRQTIALLAKQPEQK